MMGRRFDPSLGFSPMQLALGSGALATGMYAFGPDRYSFKESIKQGAVVGVGIFVLYSVLDAL